MAKKQGFIKNKVLGWLGLTDLETWREIGMMGKESAGQIVNEKTALSLSATYACVSLISETIGTLPIKIYKRLPNGDRDQDRGHGLQFIVGNSPNETTTASQFWSAVVASMVLHGNAVAEIKRNGQGKVVGLKFIHPYNQEPVFKNNSLVAVNVYEDGNQRQLKGNSLFHIPNFGVSGDWGISTISHGCEVFGSALASRQAANSTFEKGLSPTTALTIDRVIKSEQREKYREAMKEISGAINAGRTAILEAGMDAKVIGINPKDAQLLESRSFSAEEICSWFRVDPSMIGKGTAVSNWGTGLEQKMIGLLTFTLRPIITRIEQAINKYLLLPSEQGSHYAEFLVEGLLRADFKSRMGGYKVMIDSGLATRDELRVKENLPKMGGNASKLTIQSSFIPLDEAGRMNE